MNKILLERLIKDQPTYDLSENSINHRVHKLNYDIVVCPVCGRVTFDSYFICECTNEFGYNEDDSSPILTDAEFVSEEHLEKFLKDMKKCLQTSEDSI